MYLEFGKDLETYVYEEEEKNKKKIKKKLKKKHIRRLKKIKDEKK